VARVLPSVNDVPGAIRTPDRQKDYGLLGVDNTQDVDERFPNSRPFDTDYIRRGVRLQRDICDNKN